MGGVCGDLRVYKRLRKRVGVDCAPCTCIVAAQSCQDKPHEVPYLQRTLLMIFQKFRQIMSANSEGQCQVCKLS